VLNKSFLNRSILPFFATALLFGSAQASQEQTPVVPPILQGVHRVVCLGDSITQIGEGPGGYVWLIRHYLKDLYPDQNIETINAGISGHKSTDMIARFKKDVLDRKPDLVTISVGVNDVWHGFYDNHPKGDGPRGVPIDEYIKNVDSMVAQAQSQDIKVVILSTTMIYENLKGPENEKASRYNSALHDIARTHGCLFIDFQRPFRTLLRDYQNATGGHDNFLTVDGVHMNAEGNKVMAHVILSGLGITAKDQESVQKQVANEQTGRR
jgi:lysophospholipase L1-like esterase